MNAGLIGGIAGCVVGAIGGVIGTWASIRNTSGPRERGFTIKASAIGWTAGIVFLVLLFLLPSPWRFLLWVPYGILLALGIVFWNRTQERIRREEERDRGSGAGDQ